MVTIKSGQGRRFPSIVLTVEFRASGSVLHWRCWLRAHSSQRVIWDVPVLKVTLSAHPPAVHFVFFACISGELHCQIRPPFSLSKYGCTVFQIQRLCGVIGWTEKGTSPLFPQPLCCLRRELIKAVHSFPSAWCSSVNQKQGALNTALSCRGWLPLNIKYLPLKFTT